MSTPTNHWKLGLFVVVSLAVGAGLAFMLGARAFQKETVTYVSYFDEAVSGLEIGSRVSFRGVTIGNVSSIDVAPDRRHVAVSYKLPVDVLTRMGLAREEGRKVRMRVPSDVRVQLGTTGITGTKYVKLDFFKEETNPPPELPFEVPQNYIPATPSTLKNVEEALSRALEQVPEVVASAHLLLEEVRHLVVGLVAADIPRRMSTTLDGVDGLVNTLDRQITAVNAPAVARDARRTLEALDAALTSADQLLVKVNADNGLIDSLKRASDRVGDVAGGARGTGHELDRTLRDLREASQSVQRLVDALEVEPDMLLKGRTR